MLEAGDVENPATRVPSEHACMKTASSPYTWGYYSTPQNHSCLGKFIFPNACPIVHVPNRIFCLGMEEGRCYIPTARILGGTTSISDMVYTRGNKRDYDTWADLTDPGLKGGNFQKVFYLK